MSHSVTVKNGLTAYFKQPNGPSRPGVDWAVQISGEQTATVLVRTYFSTDPPREEEKPALAEKAGRFVAQKLATGWLPGTERLLEVEVGPAPATPARPWWKLF